MGEEKSSLGWWRNRWILSSWAISFPKYWKCLKVDSSTGSIASAINTNVCFTYKSGNRQLILFTSD